MIQAQAPTIEAIRRRARQRLIGAGVLVLAGVIVLPLLFDKQPRAVPVNVAIDIPGRNDVAPLPALEPVQPAAPLASSSAVAPVAEPAPAAAPAPAAVPAVQTRPAPAPPAPPINTVPSTTASKAPATPAPAARPAPATAPSSVRVVVQVGAFAEQARAQEVRQRLERAGFTTYTQIAETSAGPRIRVRVGPFDSRAEAERVAARIQQLGFQPSVLTL
jgi:DedD protein